MRHFFNHMFTKIEQNAAIQAIQNGVIMAVPAFLCGSTALLLLSLPLPNYQVMLHSPAWQPLLSLLTIIHGCTLNIITLILLITISLSFDKRLKLNTGGMLVFVNLSAYLIFSWETKQGFTFSLFNSTHLFNALIVVVIASYLYRFISRIVKEHLRHQEFGDQRFIRAMHAFIPMSIIILLFSCLHLFMNAIGISSIQVLLSDIMLGIFSSLGTTLLSGVVFIFTLHFMWFFGIHGGNVLDDVARNYFIFQQGASQIMTKTFLDTFVLFGGCGTILCLIVAIFIAERRKMVKRFVGFSTLPAIFNMNELIVFGIPIVLNPIYLIPFILTPIVLTIVSYAAMYFQLVPIPINNVEWTAPIFMSGYAATESLAGSALQLVNLIIGTCIYIPFVKMSVRHSSAQQSTMVKDIKTLVMQHEESGQPLALLDLDGELGEMARHISNEVITSFKEGNITLHYQPQVDAQGNILGAEALLRCHIPGIGYLYPPLVIALLRENNALDVFRDLLIDQVFKDLKTLQQLGYEKIILSINLTAEQFGDTALIPLLEKKLAEYEIDSGCIGLELTEQVAFEITQKSITQVMELRKLGTRIIMDDFGMGHSSMMYLLNNQFDCVKLDGSLVKHLQNGERSGKIIASIMQLSRSLHFEVVAEYVEHKEQEAMLAELGCHIYQGWLYSKAIPFSELVEFLNENQSKTLS